MPMLSEFKKRALTQVPSALNRSLAQSLKSLVKRTRIAAVLAVASSVPLWAGYQPALSQTTAPYCHLTQEAIAEKEALRQAAIQGSAQDKLAYEEILQDHARAVDRCRQDNWPQLQATWLRLYRCDQKPGVLDRVLDQIVNKGYNQVHVEVFYDGQVLLPEADNPTVWPSVVRAPGEEQVDLLAQVITKGRQRGLKVYAWAFTMNFGYTYAQRTDRPQVLAQDGWGRNSLNATNYDTSLASERQDHAFIDPYSPQARTDYQKMVRAVLKRQPDGLLFDYVRYPRRDGGQSVVSQVRDLWIYGKSARQALLQRAQNNKGRELIQRFVNQGYITVADLEILKQRYPDEAGPLWQGRTLSPEDAKPPAEVRARLQEELWLLSVAHAFQGVLDFLDWAVWPARQQNVTTGAVFFPGANKIIGRLGFDSRLQPWDRFPASMEWHPMAYALCGNTNCIADEVRQVLSKAPPNTLVMPVLAGYWGESVQNRPSLEAQMAALRQFSPQIKQLSHFAYSWQEPQYDRDRQACRAE